MTTIGDFLRDARRRLAEAGVPEPRIEPEIMLTDALGVPRHRLYAFQDDDIPTARLPELEAMIQRRLTREPLAYVRGRQEFYGMEFTVAPAVMVPRPETELLVERALLACLERMDGPSLTVVDVGTGSGCIAVCLAMHLPRARILACDVSPDALAVAGVNVNRHNLASRITLLQGDLLQRVEGPVDVIAANLPYIPAPRLPTLQPEVRFEPPLALDGGPEGLDLTLRLLDEASEKLAEGGVALLEIDPGQSGPLRQRAESLFPGATVSVEQDLAGLERLFVVDTGAGDGW